MSVNCHEVFGAELGKRRSSIALDQHARELITTALSVNAPGFLLHGGLNYVYTKQGLGIAALPVSEKREVMKTLG